MSEIRKSFDILEFLNQFCNLQPKPANRNPQFQSILNYQFNLCWAIANILTPNRFKKYTSCTKTKFLKFFDHFGVILKCFRSKTLQHILHKFNAYLVLMLLVVLELITKSLEIVQNLHRKRQKLENLLTKAHRNNKLSHCLGVLTF